MVVVAIPASVTAFQTRTDIPSYGIHRMGSFCRVCIWPLLSFLQGVICKGLSSSMLTVPEGLRHAILKPDHIVFPTLLAKLFHRTPLTNHQCDYRTPCPRPCCPRCTCQDKHDTTQQRGHSRIEIKVKRIDGSIAMVTGNNHRRDRIIRLPNGIHLRTVEPCRLRICIDTLCRGQVDGGVREAIKKIQVPESIRRGSTRNRLPVHHRRGMHELLVNVGWVISIVAI